MYTLLLRLSDNKAFTFYHLDDERVRYWINRFAGRILNFAVMEGTIDEHLA